MPAEAVADDEFFVEWPTLGYLVADWIEQHCITPDGFRKGTPYVMADWQLWCTCNHYRVREDAVWDPDSPKVSTNFVYRRSQIVAPQKTGKGPWAAAITACEALGPSVFYGWAEEGDAYACSDWGCECGWIYEYEPGEPMGRPRPTPLIQLTAYAKSQTDNVYRPLKAMFRNGWIASEATKTGEEFIRIGDDGRIDTVTSKAQSKLGNPVTFVVQDESGIWTKTNGMAEVAKTQRRGLAGMDARSIETTNCWDPAEQSVAQQTFESKATYIFRFYRKPPSKWKYEKAIDRRKIHEFVYRGSWWVNLDAIEAEAFELMETDPAQAKRFFGNLLVPGAGSWLKEELWDTRSRPTKHDPDQKLKVCLGFDGSDSDDWTVIRAETIDGWAFTPCYGPDWRETVWDPREWDGEIPRSEVRAAMTELFSRYDVKRVYCDPRDWQTEIDDWALEFGEERVLPWYTNRIKQAHEALQRVVIDLKSKALLHDGNKTAGIHITNARKLARPGDRYILGKPSQMQKIDVAMGIVLAHEAAADARATGWGAEPVQDNTVLVLR